MARARSPGRSQVDEYGLIETPILITNTLSVGAVHQGCVEWLTVHEPSLGTRDFVIPVVAETFDGFLNDVAGQHVTRDHVFAALDNATGGPVAEGNVGGGTGMMLFGFKGGAGTSSRVVPVGGQEYTVGVYRAGELWQAGESARGWRAGWPGDHRSAARARRAPRAERRDGSIIVVIGTDAPLTDRQLGRLCRRGMLGLGRVGATATHSSGDLLIAFSNAPENRIDRFETQTLLTNTFLNDTQINDLFQATIEATAEAVLNALVAAETMTGRDGNTAHALPHDRLQAIMRKYGRLRDGV